MQDNQNLLKYLSLPYIATTLYESNNSSVHSHSFTKWLPRNDYNDFNVTKIMLTVYLAIFWESDDSKLTPTFWAKFPEVFIRAT